MDLSELDLATGYRTGLSGSSDPVSGFYLPCLARSNLYLRAAGYFRSSILALVGPAYVSFARRGGKAVIVCSPNMEQSDIDAILSGVKTQAEVIEESLLEDLDLLINNNAQESTLSTLATLVSLGVIRIVIAYRPGANGMYHEKIGCFEDGVGNRATFIGSANETYSAWSDRGNFESVEVFCSWHSERDKSRTDKHEQYLRKLIANQVPGVEVLDFPEAASRKLFEHAYPTLDDIKDPVRTLITKSGKTPLPHQEMALSEWSTANYRGVLQHATGSGKTFTAIIAIGEHTKSGMPALVLVPSRLLQDQWKREISENLPSAVLLLAGGGNLRWKEQYVLASHTSRNTSTYPRITIAVMATAASREFRAKIVGGDHLFVVADEVHQIGSWEYSQFMEVESGKRLGLSATPQRHGDPEGTDRIFKYFGGVLEPIVTLQDAIAAKRLVPYEYHPHGINLTANEAEEWKSLSKRIGFLIAGNNAKNITGPSISEEMKRLLIRRSRIAKKATEKIPAAATILERNYKDGERWLVYCEDVAHMEDLAAELKDRDITTTLYHSGMQADRLDTLDWFDKSGGVILAVRCLDEGIDIPSVTHALILASSQNPRQFVQRRGRILRKSQGKENAVLHDLLVLPVDGDNDPLRSLESEFVRAVVFANDAMNMGAHAKLIGMALESGIDLQRHYVDIEDDGDE